MTTASKITLSRVLMIPVYLVTMYLSGGESNVWMYVSLAIFIIASLTDFVDGYIARHYNQVTDFGPEGHGHCRRMERQGENRQHHDRPVPDDGSAQHPGAESGGHRGYRHHHCLFRRGVLHPELEVPLGLKLHPGISRGAAFPNFPQAAVSTNLPCRGGCRLYGVFAHFPFPPKHFPPAGRI